MTAVSITTVHPEVVKERLRVISHLVTTEPEKYLKNRWELNREAVRGFMGLTPAEFDATMEEVDHEVEAKRNAE
ncbi:hypothetical protein ACK356_04455 [Aeromonas veronii]|uniref:hypothetical protein n=1 Tax=Aeromonas TaxID=642 RepID=UPI0018F18228|nr:hypothetical protein [Aeromonas veronii]MBJ7579539.1 hypothetical protein [Aeromonas veronii]MEB5666936.1 hypothetical protein [Aeromonas veronii]HDX8425933.1 hypothetical protein [Aeromonas veronii]